MESPIDVHQSFGRGLEGVVTVESPIVVHQSLAEASVNLRKMAWRSSFRKFFDLVDPDLLTSASKIQRLIRNELSFRFFPDSWQIEEFERI